MVCYRKKTDRKWGLKKATKCPRKQRQKSVKKEKENSPHWGIKKSAESIEKIRIGNLGQKRSDITKARISAAQKKRYNDGI